MPEFYHGRKLTQREYERAVVELYTGVLSGQMSKAELQKKELNLNIDYRLGIEFPESRRESLWRIQQEIENKRMSMLVKNLLVNFIPVIRKNRSGSLADFVINEYAKVLSEEELKAYFE